MIKEYFEHEKASKKLFTTAVIHNGSFTLQCLSIQKCMALELNIQPTESLYYCWRNIFCKWTHALVISVTSYTPVSQSTCNRLRWNAKSPKSVYFVITGCPWVFLFPASVWWLVPASFEPHSAGAVLTSVARCCHLSSAHEMSATRHGYYKYMFSSQLKVIYSR